MAIRIDDFDEGIDDSPFEEGFGELEFQQEEFETQMLELEDPFNEGIDLQEQEEQSDFITTLLKSRGISDPSKILYETEEGEHEEVDWNSLSVEEQMNIVESAGRQAEDGLDEDEINLINAVRASQLTPQEYIQYILKNAVDTYTMNLQNSLKQYSIDEYTDEELFVMDLLVKVKDITDLEAIDALQRAKLNEVLFKKLMESVRNAYRDKEEQEENQRLSEENAIRQAQMQQFSQSISTAISNLNEIQGWDLGMTDDDRYYVYQFLTGKDNAGNSWFGKALNDPNTVVKMAWFVLNGELMIQSIDDYYKKEITNVRKNSYAKGLQDGRNGQSNVIFKPKDKPNMSNQRRQVFDDLDEF